MLWYEYNAIVISDKLMHNTFPSRPIDFLECDPPHDFTSNKTAQEESGYGCSKVSAHVVFKTFFLHFI